MNKILTTIIIFLSTSVLSANERDAKLDKLFMELKTNITSSSPMIAQQIWSLWSTHPTDDKLTSILDEGSKLVQDKQLARAINVFTEVIELDPTWAEAWNKRATVFFLMNQYTKSLSDIEKVLGIESRHFGALSGQARIFIKLQECLITIFYNV